MVEKALVVGDHAVGAMAEGVEQLLVGADQTIGAGGEEHVGLGGCGADEMDAAGIEREGDRIHTGAGG